MVMRLVRLVQYSTVQYMYSMAVRLLFLLLWLGEPDWG